MQRLLARLLHSISGCINHPDGSSSAATTHPPARDSYDTAIPAVSYGGRVAAASDDGESCSICLTEFEIGDAVRVLPKCKHTFHRDCIDRWLPLLSLRCPNCRDRTIDRKAEPSAATCSNGGSGDHHHPMLLALNFSHGGRMTSFL